MKLCGWAVTRGPSWEGVPAGKVTVTVVSAGRGSAGTKASQLSWGAAAISLYIRVSEAISSSFARRTV